MGHRIPGSTITTELPAPLTRRGSRRSCPLPAAPAAASTLAAGLLAALLAGCTGGSSSDSPAGVPDLLIPSNEDVIAYAAIPSIDAVLRNVSDFLRRVAPSDPSEPQTPEALKSQLGMMLGDPELGSIDTTRPIVLAVLKPTQPGPMPPIVSLVPAKDGAKLSALAGRLNLYTKDEDGLVAFAQTPQALELAPKVRPIHDRFSGIAFSATARIYADSTALLTSYGPVIEMGLSQITQQASSVPGTGERLGRILKLEARMFLAVLAQLSALQVDVEVGKDWIGGHLSYRAKAGSELAALCEKSAARAAPTKTLLPPLQGISMSMALDAPSASAFYRKLFDGVAADAELKEFVNQATLDLVSSMATASDGTAVMVLGVSEAGGMSLHYDIGGASEEKLLGAIDAGARMLGAKDGLGAMYRDLGIEISPVLTRKAREHGGVAVHSLEIKSAATAEAEGGGAALPGVNPEALKALLALKVEVAVAGGRALASSDAAELDRMIGDAQAGKAGREVDFKAREVYGAGRQGYVDYDLGSLVRLMSASIPEGAPREQIQAAFESLKGVTPMLAAFAFEGPRGLFQLRLPVDMIVRLREAAER